MSNSIVIRQDENPVNPREDYEHLWTFVCWHRGYNLGDVQPDNDPTEFQENLPEGTLIYPIYMYDHSGITVSLSPFSCKWDSGQIGFAFLTLDNLRNEYGDDENAAEKAYNCLKSEMTEYDNYLRGNVWKYLVYENKTCECCGHTEQKVVDSCFGFVGTTLEETGITDNISDFTKEEIEAAWDNRFD